MSERIIGGVVLAGVVGIVLWSNGVFTPKENNDQKVSSSNSDPVPSSGSTSYEDSAPVAMPWTCIWDPTMNENWHDDVLCMNGLEQIRPELLTDWDFVTQDDIMSAASEYETELNSKSGSGNWRDQVRYN